MAPKIYFIGAGPGDPGLLTIKGKEILEKSEVVIFFKPYNKIYEKFLQNKKTYEAFKFKFEELTEIIDSALNQNKIVSFLVPGDIAIFSPYSAFLNYYKDKIEIIPGVGTLNYFASQLKFILNSHKNVHKVVIISTKILKERTGDFKLKDYADKNTTLIIFMNNIPISHLINELKDIYENDAMIHIGINLSMENEKIYSFSLHNCNLEKINIPNEKLTIIIVTPFFEMPLKIKWWNKKVEEYLKNLSA